MDAMRAVGVKQVICEVRFRWGIGTKDLKIENIKYLVQYYRFDAFASPATVEQIRASGLEEILKTEMLSSARITIINLQHELGDSQLCGTVFEGLLDDEALPNLTIPTQLEDCKSKPKTASVSRTTPRPQVHH
jgi:hypothetical protein